MRLLSRLLPLVLAAATLVAGGLKTQGDVMAQKVEKGGMPGNAVPTHLVLDQASAAGRRTLYAAVFGKDVFKSTDDGRTWSLKNPASAGTSTPGG